MSRDDLQSSRQLMTECKEVSRLKLGADPPANVKPHVIKLRDGAEPCGCQLASTLRRS
jgi:hypothetical protein